MGTNRVIKLTNKGEARFFEDSTNGANYVSLRAPDSVASNVTFKLPGADGSNGQFLKTDGGGGLSFANGTSTLQSAYDAGQAINISGSNYVNIDRAAGGEVIRLRASSSGNPYCAVVAGTSENRLGTTASGAGWVGTSSNHNLELHANGAARITVATDGDVTTTGDVTINDAKKLLWSDCNLYRSAANELKTDDSLEITSQLAIGEVLGEDYKVRIYNEDENLAGFSISQIANQNSMMISRAGSGNGNALYIDQLDGTQAAIYLTNAGTGPDIEFAEHGVKWYFGTSAPGSGTYTQGDVVWHSSPSAGGNIGWVCTTGGSPGTWKTFGTIAS